MKDQVCKCIRQYNRSNQTKADMSLCTSVPTLFADYVGTALTLTRNHRGKHDFNLQRQESQEGAHYAPKF